MIIDEAEIKRMAALEDTLTVPANTDPLEYLAEQFGEPTPHEDLPETDAFDEVHIVDLK